MEITTTTQTKIIISHTDIQDIVTNYLKEKGYEINNYQPIIKTIYDGTMNDLGTEEFMGIEIMANKDVVAIDINTLESE